MIAALLASAGLVVTLAAGCSSGSPSPTVSGSAQGQGQGQGQQNQNQPAMPAVKLGFSPADKAVDVSPAEPVTVTAAEGALTEVAMTNAAGRQVEGAISQDGRTWTSGEPLGYGKSYTVTATASGADGKAVTTTSTFTTVKPRAVTFASMNPTEGQIVGVGQPVAIYFDEAIKDKRQAERSITITTTPKVVGAFYWYSDKEVHWRPQQYWRPGTKVVADIKIYGRHLGNGIYGEEDRHVGFSIGDAVIAEADGASHQMVVKVNGDVVRQMPVSLGKPAAPSNNGIHVVTERHPTKIMDSSTYGVPVDGPDGYRTTVEWAVRISNGGEFVHSAPWSVADQGRRNVSHGCINASPPNAKWFFDLVKKGDIVVITNSGGPDLKVWDGFGDWNVPWSQWVAGGKK